MNDQLIAQFLESAERRGLSINTIGTYRGQLAGFLEYVESIGVSIREATADDLQGFLESRRKRKLRSSSIHAAASSIRQLYAYLKKAKLVKWNPTSSLELPRQHQRIPNPLTEKEMDAVLNFPGTSFKAIRNRAMIELMYSTGARVSELLSLRPDQLHLAEGYVLVMGKGSKERVLPVGPRVVGSLTKYLEIRAIKFPKSPDVFLNARGKKLGRGGFWLQLQRMASVAGTTAHPHQIRHSFATHMLAGGADIRVLQELLGHASIITTQRYAHVLPGLLKSTVKASHPRF